MKKSIFTSYRFYLLAVVCCLFVNISRAQYVTIPDATFASWLSTNGYAACMNGNQLDTTCSAVLNATSMSCSAVSIKDLTGVQYFKSLTTLDCSNDSIYTIPNLQQSILQFNCDYNNLDSLPVLPATLQLLQCDQNHLTSLPTTLPSTLYLLTFNNNQVSVLPPFPNTLVEADFSDNNISTLPASFPPYFQELSCAYNHISSIPALPATFLGLTCPYNNLTSLPALPDSMIYLQCDYNQINALPVLPSHLAALYCGHNPINSLPALPNAITQMEVDSNGLDSLPVLPDSLFNFSCESNNFTVLPALPSTLIYFDCSFNQLTSVPALPDSLWSFYCNNNPNLGCLPQIKTIVYFTYDNTAITCLPDYGNVYYPFPIFDSVPLCGIFNPNGCTPFWNISGQCYYDENNNCVFDSIDVGSQYIKTQLYSGGVLLQQVFTGGEGFYSFDSVAYGSYTVIVDTSTLPFVISCPASGDDTLTLAAGDTLSYNNNFAFSCRTQGFDLGVQSILDYVGFNNNFAPRPNTLFELYTTAGDISGLYGAHCAAGISGQVQMIYSGQVTYVGPATGAFTPSAISGDTLTWDVADYGGINDFSAFNSLFKIDSLVIAGTSLCFTVTVTPDSGDYNLSNNTLSYCFPVVASLDPNEKEAYPSGVMDTSNHWITYTIRFQNTGSAPAVNVRITDVLDSHLDPSTFQLLTYSAPNLTQIKGSVVTFNFPNVNLPDSLTSDSASRGYVQYKIKLLNNLPIGTEIQNTANIYFDLNPAVVTNTTTNFIGDSISAINNISNQQLMLTLYPNPAKNYVIVETDENTVGGTLQVTDITGREVAKLQITNSKFRVPTSALSGGVYFVKVYDLNGRNGVGKLVVE